MKAMLVGADQLGNIPRRLSEHGIQINRHLTGRDTLHQRRGVNVPNGTDLLILFTDFLGHNVMRNFRNAAESEGVRVICCKRSINSIRQSLGL